MKLLLAHGASGTARTMEAWIPPLASHGVEAIPIDLPKGKAERAIPAYEAHLAAHPGAAIGGHSYGGRVASLLAAETTVPALVLFSYPLHRPGTTDYRTAHWPDISCPVLLLSGESDPFASIDVLRNSVALLPNSTLVTYPRVRHGLLVVADDVAANVAAFLKKNCTT